MQLEFSPQDCDLLLEILQTYSSDLRSEIQRTDSVPYKKELKEKELALDRILGRLRELKSSVPTN